jgi:hypothetical protein
VCVEEGGAQRGGEDLWGLFSARCGCLPPGGARRGDAATRATQAAYAPHPTFLNSLMLVVSTLGEGWGRRASVVSVRATTWVVGGVQR